MHFRDLLRTPENPLLEKLIFEKFSEFAGKVEHSKVQFENHNKVPNDDYNFAEKRFKGLLNRNKNNKKLWITKLG